MPPRGRIGRAVNADSAVDRAIELGELVVDGTQPFRNPTRDFIAADPSTLEPFQRPFQAGARLYCRNLSATGFLNAPVQGSYVNGLCGPYLDSIGLPRNDFAPPDFEGGQCDDTAYTWTITGQGGTGSGTFIPFSSSGANSGPLNYVITGPEGGSQQLRIQSPDFAATGGVGPPVGSGVGIINVVFTITGALDGTPIDRCGSPDSPGWQPGPGAPTTPENPNFDYEDGDEGWNVNVDVSGPELNPDGSFNWQVCVEDVCIDFGGGMPGGEPQAPVSGEPDYENPGEPVGSDPEDGSIDEDVEGLACVLITVTAQPPNASVEVGGPQDRLFDAGWFRFKSPSAPHVTSAVRVREDTQIECACCDMEVTGYQVKANLGYTIQTRAITYVVPENGEV